jgi:hypothetical protein
VIAVLALGIADFISAFFGFFSSAGPQLPVVGRSGVTLIDVFCQQSEVRTALHRQTLRLVTMCMHWRRARHRDEFERL